MDDEWWIMRINEHILVIRANEGLGTLANTIPYMYKILAHGFKSETEALKYVPLFNEGSN